MEKIPGQVLVQRSPVCDVVIIIRLFCPLVTLIRLAIGIPVIIGIAQVDMHPAQARRFFRVIRPKAHRVGKALVAHVDRMALSGPHHDEQQGKGRLQHPATGEIVHHPNNQHSDRDEEKKRGHIVAVLVDHLQGHHCSLDGMVSQKKQNREAEKRIFRAITQGKAQSPEYAGNGENRGHGAEKSRGARHFVYQGQAGVNRVQQLGYIKKNHPGLGQKSFCQGERPALIAGQDGGGIRIENARRKQQQQGCCRKTQILFQALPADPLNQEQVIKKDGNREHRGVLLGGKPE